MREWQVKRRERTKQLIELGGLVAKADLRPAQDASTGVVDTELLSRQVGIAQRLVKEKPDSAVAALRQMLKENTEEAV